MDKNYIGIGDFDEFLRQLAKDETVNVMQTRTSTGSQYGTTTHEVIQVCSQAQGNDIIYHRLKVAQFETWSDGSIMGPGSDHKARCDSVEALYAELLLPFHVRKGLMAFPNDHKLLSGYNDLIHYVQAEDIYKMGPRPQEQANDTGN